MRVKKVAAAGGPRLREKSHTASDNALINYRLLRWYY